MPSKHRCSLSASNISTPPDTDDFQVIADFRANTAPPVPCARIDALAAAASSDGVGAVPGRVAAHTMRLELAMQCPATDVELCGGLADVPVTSLQHLAQHLALRDR